MDFKLDSKKQILKLLKIQITQFMDELIRIFPNEKDLVLARFLLKVQIPIKTMMKQILTELVPVEEHILAKNEKYFLEKELNVKTKFQLGPDNSDVITSEKLNLFKTLWTKTCDPEDKEVIWQWIKCFLDIGKRYQKIKELSVKSDSRKNKTTDDKEIDLLEEEILKSTF